MKKIVIKSVFKSNLVESSITIKLKFMRFIACKIDPYWSEKHWSWIHATRIFYCLYIVKFKLFDKKNKYSIFISLPEKKQQLVITKQPKWNKGEWESFLNSIRK